MKGRFIVIVEEYHGGSRIDSSSLNQILASIEILNPPYVRGLIFRLIMDGGKSKFSLKNPKFWGSKF